MDASVVKGKPMSVDQEELDSLSRQFDMVCKSYLTEFKNMEGFEFSIFVTLLTTKRELRWYRRATLMLAGILVFMCVQILKGMP
jgi:hypothetical protein